MAARAGNRMGARQQYRTMARMQRRRSAMQNSMGMHQDFQQRDDGQYQDQPQEQQVQTVQQTEPSYTAELEKLAQMKSQGLITEAEYTAKKKQILGI